MIHQTLIAIILMIVLIINHITLPLWAAVLIFILLGRSWWLNYDEDKKGGK